MQGVCQMTLKGLKGLKGRVRIEPFGLNAKCSVWKMSGTTYHLAVSVHMEKQDVAASCWGDASQRQEEGHWRALGEKSAPITHDLRLGWRLKPWSETKITLDQITECLSSVQLKLTGNLWREWRSQSTNTAEDQRICEQQRQRMSKFEKMMEPNVRSAKSVSGPALLLQNIQ